MSRNREFEVNDVLNKAMGLFWFQGYEKTSMSNLVETMGVHRKSIYNTFGDKHSLYLKAMERYVQAMGAETRSLIKNTASVKQAIRQLFEFTAMAEAGPRGCLMVNSAVELAQHDSEVAVKVNESFASGEKLLLELVTLGQNTGEIADHHNAESLASYLNNAWIGMRVLVKTSDDKEKLKGIIDTTLAILER